MGDIDLSVIIVNHNSTSLLIDCFYSIKNQINSLVYEILVVDSGSCKEEVKKLNILNKYNYVNVILKEENIGYAKAANIGLELSRSDHLLITNPDIIYLPGSIKGLREALDNLKDCGAISPRVWWDEDKTFLLPNNEYITPLWIFKKNLAGKLGFLRRFVFDEWLTETMYYIRAEEPVEVDLASGCCIMTKRKIINEIGGFDEGFSLYFEDTDWFLRVKKGGYRLYYVPKAEIVHYYNQSAKLNSDSADFKFELSMSRYLKKHFGKSLFLFSSLNRFVDFKNKSMKPFYFKDLGSISEPIRITVKGNGEKLLLLSPNEYMIPSAISFFKKEHFELNNRIWKRLADGRYYVKIIRLGDKKVLESLCFYKK